MGPEVRHARGHRRGTAHVRAAVRGAVHGRQRRRDRAGRHRRHDHDRARTRPSRTSSSRRSSSRAGRTSRSAPSSRPSSSTSQFFEAHYETYGRHVKIVPVKASGAPDDEAAAARRRDQGRDRDQGVRVVGRTEPDAGLRRASSRPAACCASATACSPRPTTYVKQSSSHVWLTFPSIEQLSEHWSAFLDPRARRADGAVRRRPRAAEPEARLRRGALRRELRRARPGRRSLREAAADDEGVPLGADIPYQLDLAKAQENARNMIAKLKAAKRHDGDLRRRPGHARRRSPRRPPRRTTSPSGWCSAPRTPTRRCSAAPTTRSSGRTRSACRRCPAPVVPTRRPAVPDPRVAVGQAAGGEDVQGARAGAADLLHRAAPRRSRPHRRRRSATACSASRPARRIRPSCTSRGATGEM